MLLRQELFSSCGTVKRLVLPPTKTLAIVEFAEAAEARSAFRGLAYKRFHHVPIYLEWAPSDIFTAAVPPQVDIMHLFFLGSYGNDYLG